MVAFNGFHAVGASVAAVAVHLKGYMLRNRALLKGSNEQLTQLVYNPFSWRRLEDQPAQHRNCAGHYVCVEAVGRVGRTILLHGSEVGKRACLVFSRL